MKSHPKSSTQLNNFLIYQNLREPSRILNVKPNHVQNVGNDGYEMVCVCFCAMIVFSSKKKPNKNTFQVDVIISHGIFKTLSLVSLSIFVCFCSCSPLKLNHLKRILSVINQEEKTQLLVNEMYFQTHFKCGNEMTYISNRLSPPYSKNMFCVFLLSVVVHSRSCRFEFCWICLKGYAGTQYFHGNCALTDEGVEKTLEIVVCFFFFSIIFFALLFSCEVPSPEYMRAMGKVSEERRKAALIKENKKRIERCFCAKKNVHCMCSFFCDSAFKHEQASHWIRKRYVGNLARVRGMIDKRITCGKNEGNVMDVLNALVRKMVESHYFLACVVRFVVS